MTEKRVRRLVVEMLRPVGAFAVENPACVGTPDVCTVIGWIELKLGKLPKKESTNVKVTLRKAQVVWLKKWIRHNGYAWTITVIEDLWFLHNASWSCDNLGKANFNDLRNNAINHWIGCPKGDQLIDSLFFARKY